MTHFRGSRILTAGLCALALLSAALLPMTPNVARAKGNRGDMDWQVLAPVSYKNLTIFPIRGADREGADAYVTLDEGTKGGTVVITEKGTRVASRGVHRGQANAANRVAVQQQAVSYNEGASVNELALVNKSGKKLLLLAGEVIVGGQQDRIVQEDRIIPPVSVPIALNVFCVEHGRWTPRNTSYSGGGASGGSAPSPRMAPAAEDAPAKFSSLGAVAHPKLRGAAQDSKEQSAVWSEVRANNAKLGTSNTTDTYQEVYASKRVSAQLDDYVRTLEREVMQPGVVGVVVARNGKPIWADIFASHRLFASYWPKLLKSYAVDALGDDQSDKRPTTEEASRYLHAREGTVSTTTENGIYQLVKTEQSAYAVFELNDISLASPLRLHFNKMDR
ncbi:MAG: hypothetical protein QOE46_3037 [Acidobacteriota bacterium]|jgi:hypothetical protein|nr:hypothetical protein [Acidobacteriota bacterium]